VAVPWIARNFQGGRCAPSLSPVGHVAGTAGDSEGEGGGGGTCRWMLGHVGRPEWSPAGGPLYLKAVGPGLHSPLAGSLSPVRRGPPERKRVWWPEAPPARLCVPAAERRGENRWNEEKYCRRVSQCCCGCCAGAPTFVLITTPCRRSKLVIKGFFLNTSLRYVRAPCLS
jgi:hypothetical protein